MLPTPMDEDTMDEDTMENVIVNSQTADGSWTKTPELFLRTKLDSVEWQNQLEELKRNNPKAPFELLHKLVTTLMILLILEQHSIEQH